jgi:hypothetical protein
VLRFTNDAFLGNPQLVLDQVLVTIESAQTLPPLRGRVPFASAKGGRGGESASTLAPSPGSLRSPPSPAEGGG